MPHNVPRPGGEPNGNEPQKPSAGAAAAGCIWVLLFVIGGIYEWNFWRGELDRREREEARRMRQIEIVPPPMTEEQWKILQERNKHFYEQLQMLQDVANKARMRR